MFASVADAGTTIVALPTIAGYFGTDLPTTQWVVIAYALTISALVVPLGRVSDVLGRKRIYLAGFAVFSGAAVAAAMSPTVTALIIFRVLMGLGAAMTQGCSMAMMIAAFPDNERGKALGLQMSAVGTGSVAGPALGGVIVTALGWRAVFLFTGTLGIASIVAASLVLRPASATLSTDRSFDWGGGVLSAAILVVFLLAMSNAPKIGWTSAPIVLALTCVAILLSLFVWWERRVRAPMLNLSLFGKRQFSVGVITRFITFLGLSSAVYLLPFYVQSVLGYSARAYGLIAVPAALCTIVVAPISGRLSDRYGWRKLTISGLGLSAVGLLLLSSLTSRSAVAFLIGGWVVQRLGHGTFTAPNNSSVLAVVDKSEHGVVAGLLNMVRNTGNVIGTGLATTIVTATIVARGLPPTLGAAREQSAGVVDAFLAGMKVACVLPAILVCLGVLLYLILWDRPENRRTGEESSCPSRSTTK
jgi:EmrB/QacA subfamily drug resistance transporter